MIRTAALIALFALTCSAQDSTRHVSVEGEGARSPFGIQAAYLRGVIDTLNPDALRPAVSGSWEEQILNAGKQAAARSLRLNLGDLSGPGIQTIQKPEGDVLIAGWNAVDSSRPERAIWLWDTPAWTSFFIEVAPATLQPQNLAGYCESLFVLDKFLSSLGLFYQNVEPGAEQIAARIIGLETKFGLHRLFFDAIAHNSRSYAVVTVKKDLLADLYPAASQVPERFPPLRTRLAGVPTALLFDELGKSRPYRDGIVMAEILSRGPLDDAGVRQLVVGEFDKGDAVSTSVVNSRVGAFLGEVQRRKEVSTYAQALVRVLLAVPLHRALEDAVAGHLARADDKNGIDYSATAFTFLEHGRYMRGSLFYLGMHGRDQATLDRLSAIPVKPEFAQEKEYALARIQRNMISKPRPKRP